MSLSLWLQWETFGHTVKTRYQQHCRLVGTNVSPIRKFQWVHVTLTFDLSAQKRVLVNCAWEIFPPNLKFLRTVLDMKAQKLKDAETDG